MPEEKDQQALNEPVYSSNETESFSNLTFNGE